MCRLSEVLLVNIHCRPGCIGRLYSRRTLYGYKLNVAQICKASLAIVPYRQWISSVSTAIASTSISCEIAKDFPPHTGAP